LWSNIPTSLSCLGVTFRLNCRRFVRMRTGSDDLNEALEKGQRTYDIHASLGGQDLSDEVSEWAVERNIDTGVPEEVGIPTGAAAAAVDLTLRSEEHTPALQSRLEHVCRLL